MSLSSLPLLPYNICNQTNLGDKNMANYTRRGAEKAILQALKELGGSASREALRDFIAESNQSGFSYNDVFGTQISKRTGKKYTPFNYDFNFGIDNLYATGYLEKPIRMGDIVLTEQGRIRESSNFPTKKEQQEIKSYWKKRRDLKKAKHAAALKEPTTDDDSATIDETTDPSTWKADLIDQINQFSPSKFESFSRLLISKMGVKIDAKRGHLQSHDHGIDGFGYFESDEFRTTRVAIQCKKYTDAPVSEPDVDKFKGVMISFDAEYGIFITTSYFTDSAKQKAVHGSNSVTLIDGQRIADLVEKYQLHVTPVQTYTLDDYYFQKD